MCNMIEHERESRCDSSVGEVAAAELADGAAHDALHGQLAAGLERAAVCRHQLTAARRDKPHHRAVQDVAALHALQFCCRQD